MLQTVIEFCKNVLFLGGTMAIGAAIASFLVSQTLYSKEELSKKVPFRIDADSEEESEEEQDEVFQEAWDAMEILRIMVARPEAWATTFTGTFRDGLPTQQSEGDEISRSSVKEELGLEGLSQRTRVVDVGNLSPATIYDAGSLDDVPALSA